MTFTDIKIEGLANSASDIKDRGDTEFRLRLTRQPDSTWNHAFDNVYNSTKDSKFRSAEIVGSEINISCHHTELKNIFIPKIQAAIDIANDQARKIAKNTMENMVSKKAEESDILKKNQNILNDINNLFK